MSGSGRRPGWDDPRRPWDGRSLEERAAAESAGGPEARALTAQERREAARQAKRDAKRERRRAEREARREERRKAQREEYLRKARAANVFDVVTRVDEDGVRHCIRCDSSDFKRQWPRDTFSRDMHRAAKPLKGGADRVAAHMVIAGVQALVAQHMVCKTCGAAYPTSLPRE